MPSPVRAAIPDIEDIEEAAQNEPEPFVDVVMVGIPLPTYRALSDEAAKRNTTIAKLLTRAFNAVLAE